MLALTDERTVGEIAAEMPSSVRVFEKYGIDFCCGGNVSVRSACQGRGLDPDAVLAEVEQTAVKDESTRDWNRGPLSELIDHIVDRHHSFLRTSLPAIEAKLQKLVNKKGDTYPELRPISRVFDALKSELDSHLVKEEMILFPLMKRIEVGVGGSHCGSVNNPISVMEYEHENAGEALRQLRKLTNDYTAPESGCNTHKAMYYELAELERDLHQHIHLENNILHPRASAMEAAL